MKKIHVAVRATDPMTLTGVISILESRQEITVVPEQAFATAEVVVYVVDRMSSDELAGLRRTAWAVGVPTVLVTREINEDALLTAIDHHVVAVIPRGAVTGERLVRSILAAEAGDGVMTPDLVGSLLKSVRGLQRDVLAPRGLSPSGLNDREIQILRLLAQGRDTNEVAAELRYSERTVKSVLHSLTSRLNLRNRTHAVAYAMRTGVI
jgi:DNA-binding NarL/FixJ family response regulator